MIHMFQYLIITETCANFLLMLKIKVEFQKKWYFKNVHDFVLFLCYNIQFKRQSIVDLHKITQILYFLFFITIPFNNILIGHNNKIFVFILNVAPAVS